MKTHNIFRKVGTILEEINEQYKYLAESPEKLNELELELLAANADFLAEHIKVLKKLLPAEMPAIARQESPAEALAHSNEYRESVSGPETIEPAEHLIKQELPSSYASFHRPVENEVSAAKIATEEWPENDIKPEPEQQHGEEGIPEVTTPLVNHFSETFTTPETITINSPESINEPSSSVTEVAVNNNNQEDFKAPFISSDAEKVPTINELMSAQRTQNSGFNQESSQQRVTDLKSIINLNDKLLFIKDLFNGYSLAYSEAIELVNRFDSFEAADKFLQTNYAQKNDWASKQATADKFYELLNRRFPK